MRASRPAPWRFALDSPWPLALLLLVPVVFLLPPLPIDETRYLAVAWEMRQSGEFLVPHLNGAPYAHKPPMLFWLINLAWTLTGVHAWTARALTLACSLASLALMHRLALRLTASRLAASLSTWFLLGTLYFAAFANAIMFDVPLATCVLIGVLGICDLADGRTRRGVAVTGLAIGAGLLVKGPVMLLDIAFVALTAPWWHPSRLAGRRRRFFGAMLLALLIGLAIVAAWALPAAWRGGTDYAHAIFLRQTLDRIEGTANTGAHARPTWWYLVVLLPLLLPWPLVLRGSWARLRQLGGDPAVRLALGWFVPTFIVFSLMSGKQAHYLLPLFPSLALLLAATVARGALAVRSAPFAVLLLAAGLLLAAVPWLAPDRLHGNDVVAHCGGGGIALLGLALLLLDRRRAHPAGAAIATLLLVLVVKFAVSHGPEARYDVQPIAAEVRAAQDRGQPVASLGKHHGVYEFAGRLTEPVPVLFGEAEILAWARQHPDGLLAGFSGNYRVRAEPVFTQPFRGGSADLWRARDALAFGLAPELRRNAAIEGD
jgi:4-amino-4-deoxy-L-arabinose transferase-like glycosyltransferase